MKLAHHYTDSDPAKAMRCAEELADRGPGVRSAVAGGDTWPRPEIW